MIKRGGSSLSREAAGMRRSALLVVLGFAVGILISRILAPSSLRAMGALPEASSALTPLEPLNTPYKLDFEHEHVVPRIPFENQSLPVIVVWPGAMPIARTVLGLVFAKNADASVVVVPYDLPSIDIEELSIIRGLILVNIESLVASSPDPVTVQLDGFAQARRRLSGALSLIFLEHSTVQRLVAFKQGIPTSIFSSPSESGRAGYRLPPLDLIAVQLSSAWHASELFNWVLEYAPLCAHRTFDVKSTGVNPHWCTNESKRFLASWLEYRIQDLKEEPLVLLKFNRPNCHLTRLLRSPDHRSAPLRRLPSTDQTICIVTPTLSSKPGDWSTHLLFTTLLPSLVANAARPTRSSFRLYIVHEAGDSGFEKPGSVLDLFALFANRTVSLLFDLELVRAPRVDGDINHLWNMGFLLAYNDECDYLFHLVDDVTMRNKDWDRVFVDALKSAKPTSNIGLVGTSFELVSMPFVHRSHVTAMKGKFYPSETHNWFGDTVVWQTYSSRHVGPRLFYDNDSDLNKKGKRRYDVCDVDQAPLVRRARLLLDNFASKLAPQTAVGPMEWLTGRKPLRVAAGLRDGGGA